MIADHIKADLGRKCADDVGAAIRRTAALVDAEDRFPIALYATATAAGSAAGFAQQIMTGSTPEQAIDALWEILRPMVLMVAGGGNADFRVMVRQAPKGDGTFKRRKFAR